MELEARRKVMGVLRVLADGGRPMGSMVIGRGLGELGFDLKDRMVRNYLRYTDEQGFTRNLGRRGRELTELGRRELAVGIAVDKVGFVGAKVEDLSHQMTFNEVRRKGSIILNLTRVDSQQPAGELLMLMYEVMQAKLGMGRMLGVAREGEAFMEMEGREGYRAVGTVCSVTLNGVLLQHGIAMTSRFGGLLEMHKGEPIRFRHIIHYDGSTLDPLEVFIKGKMTSVYQAAQTGTGVIGASFREIPTVARGRAAMVMRKLERVGLGGVLKMGKPNQSLLDIPVRTGCVGMILAGGLNPIAALEENGVNTESGALHGVCDFGRLKRVEELVGETM